MPSDQIRVVVVRNGQEPVDTHIANTLESLRAIVGGYTETVGVGPGVAIVCNDEGRLLDLPRWKCNLAGDFLFTRIDEAGDNIDLTDEDVRKAIQFVERCHFAADEGAPAFRIYTGTLDDLYWEMKGAREARDSGWESL